MHEQTQQNQSSDQRYFPRWEVRNMISYQKQDDTKTYSAYIKDLSCAGACITVNEAIADFERIKMIVHFSEVESVQLEGRVRWVREFGYQSVVGVDFDLIDENTQERILDHAYKVDKKAVLKNWYQGWGGQKS